VNKENRELYKVTEYERTVNRAKQNMIHHHIIIIENGKEALVEYIPLYKSGKRQKEKRLLSLSAYVSFAFCLLIKLKPFKYIVHTQV